MKLLFSDGESIRGRCAGDSSKGVLSLSSAFRLPRLGLVSGNRARNARSSSAATPSRPSSEAESLVDGIWVQYTWTLSMRYSKNASTCIACIHRCIDLASFPRLFDKKVTRYKDREVVRKLSNLEPHSVLLNFLCTLTLFC